MCWPGLMRKNETARLVVDAVVKADRIAAVVHRDDRGGR